MKAAGIITEYNPFHNGHLHHIQKTREITNCDVLVAVMSGNFVQRGEMAIVDKWQRAQAAIENGVDLIIELPYLCATQSAQQFAQSSVDLLNIAEVTDLVFGSESNDLEKLKEIASMSFKVDYLKEALQAGEGYAKAYSLGTTTMQANDILAVAYLKALEGTAITPHCIARSTHYHDAQLHQGISSATAIRRAYYEKDDITHDCAMEIHEPTVNWNQFFPYLKMLFLTLPKEYLSQIFLFSEGIENHLFNVIFNADHWDAFLSAAITKRYTKARIQRTCLHLLNQITKQEKEQLPSLTTLRVLAFNEVGQQYLKQLQKKEVPIASRFAQVPRAYREMELKTTRLYASLMKPEDARALIEKEIGGALRILKKDDTIIPE